MALAALVPSQANTLFAQEGAGGVTPPKSFEAGEWRIRAFQQEKLGSVYKLRGAPRVPVELENSTLLLRADELDYDEESGDVHARGSVYFHHFEKNEQLWADRVDYYVD